MSVCRMFPTKEKVVSLVVIPGLIARKQVEEKLKKVKETCDELDCRLHRLERKVMTVRQRRLVDKYNVYQHKKLVDGLSTEE
jgi:hypothetical protein